jgi:hypothetical protein
MHYAKCKYTHGRFRRRNTVNTQCFRHVQFDLLLSKCSVGCAGPERSSWLPRALALEDTKTLVILNDLHHTCTRLTSSGLVGSRQGHYQQQKSPEALEFSWRWQAEWWKGVLVCARSGSGSGNGIAH